MGRLNAFARWCDTQKIELEQVKVPALRKYLDYLQTKPHHRTGKELSSYTVHGHMRVVRTFLNWCSQEDELENLVSEKTTRKMTMPRVDEKVIETFTSEQIKALLAACDKEVSQVWRVRDRAIVSVLVDTGIRAGELCSLTLDNVDLDPRGAYIKVMGKGRKEREVPLGKKALTALHKYIRRYREAPKEETHVFLSKGGQEFTVSGLVQVIERLAGWAHIEGVHCHRFRHTFAITYLKNGGDVYKLSRLLGHASIQITTDVYLRAFKAREARMGAKSVLDNL
jgi:integrase/recombinase XerD